MTTVGIAVITRNRCNELMRVLDAIEAHTECAYDLVVAKDRCTDDTQEMLVSRFCVRPAPVSAEHGLQKAAGTEAPVPGIAANRNAAFYHFRDKDVVFMFEDDYYPVKDGWERPYVDVLTGSSQPALFALDEGHGPVVDSRDLPLSGGIRVLYRLNLTTQMVAINTRLLDTLGYFNPGYGTNYGFEDSEWGVRGRDAGLFGSLAGFPCLEQEGVFEHIRDPASSDGKTQEQREADIKVNFELFKGYAERPTFLAYPH